MGHRVVSTYSWSPAPRPAGGTVDVVGTTCRCSRALYVDVRGDLRAGVLGLNVYDHERCRGCDELAPSYYCPSATVPA